MLRRYTWLALALVAACDDPAGPTEQPLTLLFPDPVGDTVPTGGPPAVRATDAVNTRVTVAADTVVIEMEFASPITPWSQELANGLDGFLDLDLDENAATGIPGAADAYGGSAAVGAEYYLDFRDDGAGTIDLVEPVTNTRRPVQIGYSQRAARVSIPRSLLADPDGQFRLAYIVETLDRPVSDFVPNTGNYRVAR
jgi:hypothetical protein